MPTVLITGASRGLGLEFARQYAADGWNVVACCRDPGNATALNVVKGVRVEALDVTGSSSRAALGKRMGDTPVDLLINNAGIYGDAAGQSFGTLDSEAWLDVLRTNTIAPIMLIESLLPNLKRGSGKQIVNITSRMGALGEMGSGSIAYRSSKTALNAAMRTIAHELQRDGIAIVNLHPGWVRTDMGGKGAQLSPEQSVSSMRGVIAGLTAAQNGAFLNYDGQGIAW